MAHISGSTVWAKIKNGPPVPKAQRENVSAVHPVHSELASDKSMGPFTTKGEVPRTVFLFLLNLVIEDISQYCSHILLPAVLC